MPGTFSAISELIGQENATLERFVEVIENDPAVSANVLRIVNSAWFGLRTQVSSLREAVRLIGSVPLRNVALTAELYGTNDHRVAGLRTSAMQRLAALPMIAQRLGVSPVTDEATTAIVLADVGSLVLSLRAPEEAAAIEAEVQAGKARIDVEDARLGATHAAIGAVLLSMWNLPRSLVDAVALHHETKVTPGSPTLCTLVALTCRLHELHAMPARATLREQALTLASAFGTPDLDALLECFGTASPG
jgi:HD-like signal output (HDOD) protein